MSDPVHNPTQRQATLIPHPKGTPGAIHDISVTVVHRGGRLKLRYVVRGDIGAVAWPSAAEPGRADGLWEHTCFEAFVGTDAGYVEFNLSPSGQWASYAFTGYRQGMRPDPSEACVDRREQGPREASLEAAIDLPVSATSLGLSAVIEAVDGSLSYWALKHPAERADFHHPECFVLSIPEPA